MRYSKPDASGVQREIKDLVQAGEGCAFNIPAVVVSIGAALTGLITGIDVNPLLFVFLVIPLLSIWVWISYYRTTQDIGSLSGDYLLNKTVLLMEPIRGTDLEPIAQPMYVKVFEHAQVHSAYSERCDTCESRIETLGQLVPADRNPKDSRDLEQARQFLEIRKELEGGS